MPHVFARRIISQTFFIGLHLGSYSGESDLQKLGIAVCSSGLWEGMELQRTRPGPAELAASRSRADPALCTLP